MAENLNGLTPISVNTTWSSGGDTPAVLDTDLRGGLRLVSGEMGDRLSDINGQLLQDGMMVFLQTEYTTDGGTTFQANTYYKYRVQSGDAPRNENTGRLVNNDANWILFSDGSQIAPWAVDGNTDDIPLAKLTGQVPNVPEVLANTAKVGITQEQADAITANTAKVGITTEQAAAIVANTAKVGITQEQADAITANTAKSADSFMVPDTLSLQPNSDVLELRRGARDNANPMNGLIDSVDLRSIVSGGSSTPLDIQDLLQGVPREASYVYTANQNLNDARAPAVTGGVYFRGLLTINFDMSVTLPARGDRFYLFINNPVSGTQTPDEPDVIIQYSQTGRLSVTQRSLAFNIIKGAEIIENPAHGGNAPEGVDDYFLIDTGNALYNSYFTRRSGIENEYLRYTSSSNSFEFVDSETIRGDLDEIQLLPLRSEVGMDGGVSVVPGGIVWQPSEMTDAAGAYINLTEDAINNLAREDVNHLDPRGLTLVTPSFVSRLLDVDAVHEGGLRFILDAAGTAFTTVYPVPNPLTDFTTLEGSGDIVSQLVVDQRYVLIRYSQDSEGNLVQRDSATQYITGRFDRAGIQTNDAIFEDLQDQDGNAIANFAAGITPAITADDLTAAQVMTITETSPTLTQYEDGHVLRWNSTDNVWRDVPAGEVPWVQTESYPVDSIVSYEGNGYISRVQTTPGVSPDIPNLAGALEWNPIAATFNGLIDVQVGTQDSFTVQSVLLPDLSDPTPNNRDYPRKLNNSALSLLFPSAATATAYLGALVPGNEYFAELIRAEGDPPQAGDFVPFRLQEVLQAGGSPPGFISIITRPFNLFAPFPTGSRFRLYTANRTPGNPFPAANADQSGLRWVADVNAPSGAGSWQLATIARPPILLLTNGFLLPQVTPTSTTNGIHDYTLTFANRDPVMVSTARDAYYDVNGQFGIIDTYYFYDNSDSSWYDLANPTGGVPLIGFN